MGRYPLPKASNRIAKNLPGIGRIEITAPEGLDPQQTADWHARIDVCLHAFDPCAKGGKSIKMPEALQRDHTPRQPRPTSKKSVQAHTPLAQQTNMPLPPTGDTLDFEQ